MIKRALVLSGGGAKGAFQAGVLRGIALEAGAPFEYVTGVSVGALNAAGLAQFSRDDFTKATRWIEALWTGGKMDLRRSSFLSYVSGWRRPFLGHNRRLSKLISSEFDLFRIKTSDVSLLVHAVDLSSGDLRSFGDQSAYLSDDLMACASFPVAYPPRLVGKRHLTDGATIKIELLKEVIEWGAEHITVILDADPAAPARAEIPKTVPSMLAHVLDLNSRAAIVHDIQRCQHINDKLGQYTKIGKRKIDLRVIAPDHALGDPLDFSAKHIRALFEAGVKCGKNAK